ncbi:Copper chaperone CopZ [Clostridium liquoris]|jgi:Cu+-exporting ATPase|uniref:Copper chaperone CopZ n=1 Tax=Clostridium liquoris TaxID=1289519 RepID=A0A2T0B8B6_9CLOT|nr:heavy-metal-associated domain-containing protein [Clostridium liquoris]PRR80124.1 Copper chaperone CopZ [Clostridium liquoris]
MKKKISIEGMSCMHCVNHVKEALEEIGGKNVDVNLSSKLAVAEFNEDVTDNKIKDIIKDYGYEVVNIE